MTARDEGAGTMGRGEEADLGRFILQEHELTGLHPRTAKLVRTFAFALAGKLRKAEQKYGYSDGWSRGDWEAECRTHLHEHVAKGDPLDVAAYSAFCWSHGWSTAAPVSAPGMGWIDGRRFSEQAGERWRHVKSGGVYSLPFGRAEAMVQCAEPITYENTLTVYIGEDGMIFARPTHEFHDGRFVRLPADSGVDADEGRAGNLPPDEPIPSTPPFIQWNGGDNPAPGKRVEWRSRDGDSNECQANDLAGWSYPHEAGPAYDIIAYRIIPTDDQGGEG